MTRSREEIEEEYKSEHTTEWSVCTRVPAEVEIWLDIRDELINRCDNCE